MLLLWPYGTGCSQVLGADFDVHLAEPVGTAAEAGPDVDADAGPDADAEGGSAQDATDGPSPDQEEVLASAQGNPWDILVAGGFVYWTSSSDGTPNAATGKVSRLDLGTRKLQVLAQAHALPNRLSIDGDYLYWTDVGFGADGGSVWRTSVQAGGTPQQIAESQHGPVGVLADGQHVYWGDTGGGAIRRLALAEIGSGQPETLFSGRNSPSFLALVGTTLYWTEFHVDGGVWKGDVSTPGASPVPLLEHQQEPNALVVSGDVAFFANLGGGSIIAAPLDGAGHIVLAEEQEEPAGVAVDSGYVYWANHTAGTVMRVPGQGGTPEIVAHGQLSPNGVATDAEFVYWTCMTPTGSVKRIRKPQ